MLKRIASTFAEEIDVLLAELFFIEVQKLSDPMKNGVKQLHHYWEICKYEPNRCLLSALNGVC